MVHRFCAKTLEFMPQVGVLYQQHPGSDCTVWRIATTVSVMRNGMEVLPSHFQGYYQFVLGSMPSVWNNR